MKTNPIYRQAEGFTSFKTLHHVWPVALCIVVAALLNYGLDENNANQYLWLLTPIAWLLEISQSTSFELTGLGYHLQGTQIVIAPECAGLRFLGISLIGGSLLLATHSRLHPAINIGLLILVAYGLTILASFARILAWIRLESFTGTLHTISTLSTKNGIDLHAIMGLVIYLIFFIIGGALWLRLQEELRL